MGGRLGQVAPGVLVATSASFMATTTTVVVASDGGCLVIDPGVSVPELRGLAAVLAARGLAPRAGFATHPHWDHVLWHASLGDVPRYASPRAAAAARATRPALAEAAERDAPGHDAALIGALTPLADGAEEIGWDGPPARLVIHDGHAPGHSAVFLPEAGVLVAGDMCSDIEIPLLDPDSPDPLGAYRAGLDALAAVPGVRLVVPGHGRVTTAAGFRRRVAADRRYLDGLQRGGDATDPRLAEDWLRREHEAQMRLVRGEGPR